MAVSDEFVEHPVGEDLYALKKAPRKIRIYVGDSVVCSGAGGGACIIRPKIFIKKNGDEVGGFVDIYITDVLSYGDMIYNGVSTLAGDTLLQASGMMDVVAVQGTDTLQLKPGASIDITMPAPWSAGLRVFTGVINSYAENSITWTAARGTVEAENPGVLVKGIDTLSWTAIAKTITPVSTGSLFLSLPTGFDASNTLAYLLIAPGKTIMNFTQDSNGLFSTGMVKIPAGSASKVVVVSKANNKYYYSDKSILTTGSDTLHFNSLPEVTLTQLHVKLDAL
jgi:hypothetical protein